MLLTNLVIILLREYINSMKTAFYFGFSEVYLFNIIICLFVLKKAKICMVVTIFTIIILDGMNIYLRNDYEYMENCVSTVNGCIITWCIMVNGQRESEENYSSKKIIKEKKQMLRKILRLFPSGIMFYNKKEGIFYKNKFWIDLLTKFKKEHKFRFWTNRRNLPLDLTVYNDVSSSDFENLIGDKETQTVLECLFLRENTKHTLRDEILKIHSHFYENDVEINKIDEYGMDDFIYKENIEYNEYEIRDVFGKQISEFIAKFAAFNFSPDDKSIMVVINDISERAKLRETKISEMLKTVMLCSISHELRSPVNQINGVLTLLLPTMKTQEQKHLIRIANSSTELLKLKVDDMLDFYEVETRNFKPEMKVFDPRRVLANLRTLFSPMIDKNKTRLYFFVHERTPEVLFHDTERIRQIMVNLMSNAIKYTKKGMVTAVIDWKPDENQTNESEGTVKFSVSDTGCGISKERKKNLFNFLDPENFKEIRKGKLCDPNTTKLAGTGLGISQEIARRLGSKIEFTSSEGFGSKFWFKLKIDPSQRCQELSSMYRKSVIDEKEDFCGDKNHFSYTLGCRSPIQRKSSLQKCPSLPLMDNNPDYQLVELNKIR